MSRPPSLATDQHAAPIGVHRVSWGAIIAGSVIGAALMVFFATLGVGIGTAALDPAGATPSSSTFGIAGGIYTIATQIVAVAVGGFVAARLAGVPRTMTAMLHGATVWGVTTLFLALTAVVGASAILGGASSIVRGTAGGAANLVEAVAPDDLSLPDPAELAGRISFDQLPDELRETLENRNVTPQALQREVREAFRQVVSEEEQQQIVAEARETLQSVLQSPGTADEEFQAFLDETLGGPNAILNDEDRQQALDILERRTGISAEEAEQLVASVEARIDEQVATIREELSDARQQAIEAADRAAEAASRTAFGLALVSALCLVAGCLGAILGRPSSLVGSHRADRA